MFTQSAEDTGSILGSGFTDSDQVALADVSRAVANHTVKYGFIHGYAKLLHQIFTHGKHTLIGAVLFGKALFRKRSALVDIHDVHRAVANIAEHIDTLKLTELVCNRRKALRENLMKQFGISVDETVLERVIRHGTADISQRYLTAIRDTATEYAEGIFRRLREHEYDPELMRLYVVGGGSCILKNFGSYDKDRVIINDDICATAKGYELLAEQKQSRKGGIV